MQDPLVHHGCHFGQAYHVFCNVQVLLTNGMTLMAKIEDHGQDSLKAQ
jgi:hypothetical protein